MVMVLGKPRHTQSAGSVKRTNDDIKDMLVAWLVDNDTQDWVTGIMPVQFQTTLPNIQEQNALHTQLCLVASFLSD